jgi:hypothetical protein
LNIFTGGDVFAVEFIHHGLDWNNDRREDTNNGFWRKEGNLDVWKQMEPREGGGRPKYWLLG